MNDTYLPLGKQTPYPREYSPSLLVGIQRGEGRRTLGITDPLPFGGVDLWNAYELSWLDGKGKPVVATAELRIPVTSPCIAESKSLKLYLNSLNATRHDSAAAVRSVITADVQRVVGSAPEIRLRSASDPGHPSVGTPGGTCIDDADVALVTYDVDPRLLEGSVDATVDTEEALHSHLLKSNCPITGQPDWATLFVRYRGGRIDHSALLRYIVSYRNHDEFHEQCVERIFTDILRYCEPRALTVFGRYTRRGGVEVNPFRSNFEDLEDNVRTWRQ